MSMVFADFMNPMDRELESFKLSLESHMRQIDLMKESTNGMLKIAYLEAEQAVLENGGDYDMLSDFYMEAEETATEQKTGIVRSIINWISRQFSKLSDWLSNVFGSKTKQRLDPNKNYTVNKTAFNFFKSLPTKIIDGIESAVNAITSNKAVDLGAMITSVVALVTNDKLKKHLTSFMDAVKGKKTNTKGNDGGDDPVGENDTETETVTGEDMQQAVDNGTKFLDRLKAVIAKIDKYLSEKRTTAVEKRVEAKNKKNETPTTGNNTGGNGNQGTEQATQNTGESTGESAEDDLSLYDAIQYFQEKTNRISGRYFKNIDLGHDGDADETYHNINLGRGEQKLFKNINVGNKSADTINEDGNKADDKPAEKKDTGNTGPTKQPTTSGSSDQKTGDNKSTQSTGTSEDTSTQSGTGGNSSGAPETTQQTNSPAPTQKNTGDSRPAQSGNNGDTTTQPTQSGNNGTDQAEDKKEEKLTVGDNIIVTLQVIVEILRDLFSFVKNGFVHLAKSLPWVKSDEEEDNNSGDGTGSGKGKGKTGDKTKETNNEEQSDGDTQSEETKTESAALFAYLDDQSDLNVLEEGVPDDVLDTLDQLFTEM